MNISQQDAQKQQSNLQLYLCGGNQLENNEVDKEEEEQIEPQVQYENIGEIISISESQQQFDEFNQFLEQFKESEYDRQKKEAQKSKVIITHALNKKAQKMIQKDNQNRMLVLKKKSDNATSPSKKKRKFQIQDSDKDQWQFTNSEQDEAFRKECLRDRQKIIKNRKKIDQIQIMKTAKTCNLIYAKKKQIRQILENAKVSPKDIDYMISLFKFQQTQTKQSTGTKQINKAERQKSTKQTKTQKISKKGARKSVQKDKMIGGSHPLAPIIASKRTEKDQIDERYAQVMQETLEGLVKMNKFSQAKIKSIKPQWQYSMLKPNIPKMKTIIPHQKNLLHLNLINQSLITKQQTTKNQSKTSPSIQACNFARKLKRDILSQSIKWDKYDLEPKQQIQINEFFAKASQLPCLALQNQTFVIKKIPLSGEMIILCLNYKEQKWRISIQ